jgi:hypothetical protein
VFFSTQWKFYYSSIITYIQKSFVLGPPLGKLDQQQRDKSYVHIVCKRFLKESLNLEKKYSSKYGEWRRLYFYIFLCYAFKTQTRIHVVHGAGGVFVGS